MSEIESHLNRWQSAGVLDAESAERIRAFERVHEVEAPKPSALTAASWTGVAALILGGLLLACGVVLFVNAHWDEMGPGARFALVMAMVAVFHVGGAAVRERFHGMSTTLHGVGTVATGAAIALVGQIFNIEEHWPAAVLMWAVAAAVGWLLLRDQVHQILTLLLFPAWMLCEIEFAADGHTGLNVYGGRFLLVWAALYLTFFVRSKRKAVFGVLFGVAAIAAIVGVVEVGSGWIFAYGGEGFIPFGARVWAWIAIAAIPLAIAAFHGHKGIMPPTAALALGLALPWCQHSWIEYYTGYQGVRGSYPRSEPNLLAHALVAAFAVFLIWWGVRLLSRSLVNLGIGGFAVAVAWFYWSDIFDKIGRSLGLIGLGVLFLLGGWALERMRRRLMAGMNSAGGGAA